VDDLITRACPQPRDPPIARVGQVIEPLETGVAQVRNDQRTGSKTGDHRTGGDLLVLSGIGAIRHAPPLLQAQIEESGERASEEVRIAGGQGTQGGQ